MYYIRKVDGNRYFSKGKIYKGIPHKTHLNVIEMYTGTREEHDNYSTQNIEFYFKKINIFTPLTYHKLNNLFTN